MIRLRMLVLLLPMLAMLGCLDVLTGSTLRSQVALLLVQDAESSLPLDGERVDVTISGPGIEPPIFGSFRFINDTARAQLLVPVGRDRLVLVAVFDSANTLVAAGEAIVEVGAGVSINVPVQVAPTVGSLPIIVTAGTTTLTVTPGSLTLAPGDTAFLSVSITDQTGAAIPGAVPTFASSNPSIATASSTGAVIGRLQGVTAVTVSALGVAARVPVGVVAPLIWSP